MTDKKGIAGIRMTNSRGIGNASGSVPTAAIDDLADQVSNVQIDQRPTLRNLVDLGAASGANIAIINDNDEEDDDEQDEDPDDYNSDNNNVI